jgi:predicted ATP-grasp superfamily ATP-dependent carboligase
LILEINPRLTSSYAGINEATGLNVAELVLAMLNKKIPIFKKTKNHPVLIDIN